MKGFMSMIEKLESLTGGASNSDEQKQQLRIQENEISTRYLFKSLLLK